jgi:hypothetical protein
MDFLRRCLRAISSDSRVEESLAIELQRAGYGAAGNYLENGTDVLPSENLRRLAEASPKEDRASV